MNFNPSQMPGSKRCFMVEKIPDRYARFLRRYVSSSEAASSCPAKYGYHNAEVRIEDGTKFDVSERYGKVMETEEPDLTDSRWPTQCPCGYVFTPEDSYQIHRQWLYRNVETGEEYTDRALPVGAMFYSDNEYYLGQGCIGPDGKCLMVIIPSKHGCYEWCPDSRASNCTMPADKTHRCWVRHGIPPLITVDKNGNTCAAGAGSIATPDGYYHGFLQQGYLTNCPG